MASMAVVAAYLVEWWWSGGWCACARPVWHGVWPLKPQCDAVSESATRVSDSLGLFGLSPFGPPVAVAVDRCAATATAAATSKGKRELLLQSADRAGGQPKKEEEEPRRRLH